MTEQKSGRTERRAEVDLDGPFYEGDVLTIPFDFLNVPLVTAEHIRPAYRHYVVLDKLGWWGRRYRLRGVRGRADTLHLALPRMVVTERKTDRGESFG